MCLNHKLAKIGSFQEQNTRKVLELSCLVAYFGAKFLRTCSLVPLRVHSWVEKWYGSLLKKKRAYR